MKKIAILCNNESSRPSDRKELMLQLHENGFQPYCGGIHSGTVNEYFSEQTAIFLPIEASRSNTNPLVELKSMMSVKRAIKANGIECAIVYGVKNHAAMAIGAKMGGAKRVMCVVNGSGNLFRVGGFKGWLLRRISFPMLRIAYKRSVSVCFQNSDDLELFIKKRLVKRGDKCFVTGGSGINLDVFSPAPMPKENRFLLLTRITPSKGAIEYMRAAEIVKKKYPDAVFDLVGPVDGAVENSIGEQFRKYTENGTVAYHGATTDVPSWMKKCRFFVYPSYYPEGVPRCAIQAIATARPIITCRTPGCKETVIDGVNGFAVMQKDVLALSEKMIWMIEHPTEAEKMAEASRRLAEDKFDVFKVNKQLIDKMKA